MHCFEGLCCQMNEGRKSQIVLPDERRLDILIQPKLNAGDLLDLVASHFKLKQKEYFGLAFQDDTGHYNWLQADKRVLEHEFPRKTGVLVLFFSARFYIESIAQLLDTATVEVFYLNAKQNVFKGQIECDSETIFELAAQVLQAINGDFTNDQETKAELKKLPVIPTSALKEHPSISYCEDRVILYYKKLAGTSRGLAIVNYMTIVESLPTYGIHYYEVKDKKDIPWWLGLSHKGIGVYDKNDKTTPRRIYTWKNLENLYYRDKKFSIEVHDPKRVVHTLSSFNLYEDAIREPIEEFDELSDAISDPTTQVSVSRRTFGPGNVTVHAWFGSNPQLTKCIWSMAVAQHQFYLDRKNSKVTLPSVRSVSELAAELSRSTTSLPGSVGSDLSRSGSSQSIPSLTTSRFDLTVDPNCDSAKAQREMYQALKARKEALEDALRKKTEELKLLCIKEGELTGELPPETPLVPGEQIPQIRRRVGTSFVLSSKFVHNNDENEDALSKLELEFELQRQITSAALRLAQDKGPSKYVRKQRKQSYTKALNKLKEMEKKVNDMRTQIGKAMIKTPAQVYDDHELGSPAQSPTVQRYIRRDAGPGEVDEMHSPTLIHRSNTAPRELSPAPTSPLAQLSPTHSSPSLAGGYLPSSVYATKMPYRNQMYPTFSSRTQSSTSNQSEYENARNLGRLEGSQDSGFSSANNMYNVTSQRTSRYDSTDQLPISTSKDSYPTTEVVFEDKLQLPSKHGSLDGTYRKSSQRYGSLERNKTRKHSDSEHERARGRKFSDSDANMQVQDDLVPSKYGSKRESQSEYEFDPPVPRNSMIEVPVSHEESSYSQRDTHRDQRDYHHRPYRDYHESRSNWEDSVVTEPSPIIHSPQNSQTEPMERSESPQLGQCYSPRIYEGRSGHGTPYTEHSVGIKRVESPHTVPQASTLITVSKLSSPHVEVSKPFEMSDFYKYSEKLRRQRLVEQCQQQLMGDEVLSRSSTPSQHSSDSADTSHSGSTSYHHSHSPHVTMNMSPTHSTGHVQYRPGSQSSPYGTPVMQRSGPVSPYPPQKREFDHPTYSVSRGTPAQFQSSSTVKERSTSHVQYSVQTVSGQRVSYKHVQTSKHTQYHPLNPMKCNPVRDSHSSSSSSASHSSKNSTR